MPRFRVTKPVYFTATFEAADEDEAISMALDSGHWNAEWEADDCQPSLDPELDLNVEQGRPMPWSEHEER